MNWTTRGVAALVAGAALFAGMGTATALTLTASHAAPAAAAAPHKVAPAHKAAKPAHHAVTPIYVPLPAKPSPAVLAIAGYDGTEPGFISFSGDGGNVVTNISWQDWGTQTATGTGTSYLQGCVPDCATGTETPVTATIWLGAPASGRFTWYTETRNGQVSSGPVSQMTGAQQYSGDAPPAPAAPTPFVSQPPPSGDPVEGSGTGPACTTKAGYFPGGEAGHEDSTGFCVADAQPPASAAIPTGGPPPQIIPSNWSAPQTNTAGGNQ